MWEITWLVVVTLALLALAGFAFFLLPQLVVSTQDAARETSRKALAHPAPYDLTQARNGVRTAAVALLTAVGAALATGFAGRTYYLTRRTQDNDIYTHAVELLDGDHGASAVFAVSELERIARHNPSRQRQVMKVLATFLREDRRGVDNDEPSPAVQAACTALSRRRSRHDRGLVIDLAGADLRQVSMDGARLRGAILRDADLRGAFLRSADLREANISNSKGQSMRLDRALLSRAVLDGAELQGATLDDARACEASFARTMMDGTFIRGADLRDSRGLRIADGAVVGAVADDHTRLSLTLHDG